MKINNLTPNVMINQTQSTKTRQTVDNSFGAKLQQGLAAAGNAVGSFAGMAVAALPGGTILSAALAGAGNVGTSTSALTANSGQAAVAAAGTNAAAGSGSPANSALSNLQQGNQVANGYLNDARQLMKEQASMNMAYLQIQQEMQNESKHFMTLSNVLKNRTDTAKNSIRNIN